MVDEARPTILPDNFSQMRAAEVQKQSLTIAQTLIQKPRFLADFLTTATNYFFSAQAEGDQDEQQKIQSLVTQIDKQIGSFKWDSLNETQLESEDARGILRSLYTVDHDEKMPNRYKSIVRRIARGYLTERFDQHKETNVPEWEGALLCQQELLHSVIRGSLDLEGLNVWFELMIGKNEAVMPKDSVGWRASYVAMRNPVSIPGMEVAAEVVSAVELLANFFDRRDEWQANSTRFNRLTVQLIAAREVIKAEGGIKKSFTAEGVPKFESALSPNAGQGQKLYRAFFKEPANIAQLKAYGDLDFTTIAKEPVPMEIATLAILQEVEPDISASIEFALTYLYQIGQSQQGVMGRAAIPQENGTPIFPFNIFLAETESLARIRQLIDPVKMKNAFNEFLATALQEKGKDWEKYPFTYKTATGQTISGYYCAPVAGYVTDQQSADMVKKAIEEHKRKIEEIDFTRLPSEAVTVQVENGMFVVARPQFVEKTQLEFMLDRKIPDEKRSSIESTREHIVLSRRIPGHIHLIPTLKGYQYKLLNHPDLPRVIEKAVIKRRKQEIGGGLAFSLDLTKDTFTFGDEAPRVSGLISLESDKVSIIFDGDAAKLSSDLRILLENVVMHLLEDLCCPPLNEKGQEKSETVGKTRQLTDIPGSIVHIGIRTTKEGVVKQGMPTDAAEMNLQMDKGTLRIAQQQLRADVGANLAHINVQHQKDHEGKDPDPRFLTYRRGHDLTPEGDPHELPAPERILGLE